jgi:hypothetical protein
MTNKYTYYLNINNAGYYQIWPGNNQLIHTYKIEEQSEGHATEELTGSFSLTGSNYTALKTAFENNYSVYLQIYENGTISTGDLVCTVLVQKFNEFDENTQTVYLKNFLMFDLYYLFNSVMDAEYEYYLSGTTYQLNYGDYGKITDYSYQLTDIIDTFSGIYVTFDENDCWYNTEGFELDKIRLANLKDLAWLEISENNTAQRKKLTIKRILEILEYIFRAYWYISNDNKLKFKRPEDLVNVILDIPDELVNLQRKNYDESKRFKTEMFKFNKNNNPYDYAITEYDENTNRIEYSVNSKNNKTYELQDICTYFNTFMEYNLDGFLMAHVDGNTVVETMGVANGALTPAYLFATFYQDYIYTDNTDYTYSGNTPLNKPTRFRPFIELPEVTKSLDSIATFYEGIRFKNSGGNEIIGRVLEMSTNLFINQTKFRSFEFTNTQI